MPRRFRRGIFAGYDSRLITLFALSSTRYVAKFVQFFDTQNRFL